MISFSSSISDQNQANCITLENTRPHLLLLLFSTCVCYIRNDIILDIGNLTLYASGKVKFHINSYSNKIERLIDGLDGCNQQVGTSHMISNQSIYSVHEVEMFTLCPKVLFGSFFFDVKL
jgi:hypothetical protein